MLRVRLVNSDNPDVQASDPVVAGVEIAPGVAALVTIAATATTAAPITAAITSAQLVAANSATVGGAIVNNGTTKLHVQFSARADGGPAEVIVAPGGSTRIPPGYLSAITGWWEKTAGGASPTGTALVTTYTVA